MEPPGDQHELRQTVAGIAVRPVPACIACGSPGVPLYHGLRDRLHHVPGEWNVARCPARRCGLLWMDPMPTETAGLYPADYYTHSDSSDSAAPAPRGWRDRLRDAATHGYLARYGGPRDGASERLAGALVWLNPSRRAEADAHVMYLRPGRSRRLLDVGCGDGELLERMRGYGWEVRGVEADPRAAATARQRGIPVDHGLLEDLGYAEGSFEAVTMSHVVEHVPDPHVLLSEAWRILAPGGQLVVVTPNAGSLGHRRFGSDWFPLEPPRHLYLFTLRSLRRVAARAGIAPAKIRSTIRYAHYFLQLSEAIRRTGRSDEMRVEGGLAQHVSARATQAAEWVLRPVAPGTGEEMVLRAVKPVGSSDQVATPKG